MKFVSHGFKIDFRTSWKRIYPDQTFYHDRSMKKGIIEISEQLISIDRKKPF
jgi:hypothetical protein